MIGGGKGQLNGQLKERRRASIKGGEGRKGKVGKDTIRSEEFDLQQARGS